MFSKRLAAETAGGPDGPAMRDPAPKLTGGMAMAGAALFFVAAAALLLSARGNPYDGGPVARAHILFSAAESTVSEAGRGPSLSGAGALVPAPIAGLSAPGPGGLLPIIAADGRTPAQIYARPFRDTGAPKAALVIGGLGLNAKTTRQAIQDLPAEITLSFVPYAEGLQGWIDLARANGHEVLLEAPMEPLDYPQNDPGPYTLMAQDPPQETIKRLELLLSRATGYFAVTNYLGGRFVASDSAMALFAAAMHKRGLGFVDDGSAASRGGAEPRASAERVIDQDLDGGSIDQQLQALEASAQRCTSCRVTG